MATQPTGTPNASLADRAKNIIMQPRAEWPRIDAEPDTIGGIYKRYVIILAAIGPVAGLIGMLAFGVRVLGFTYRPPVGSAIATAVVQYLLSLASVYILALIIEALAPTFGGTKDRVKAFKVAAYSMTAAWLAGIFAIIPNLAWLGLVGLYSFYLLYLGLPVLMKVSQDKAVGYWVAAVLTAIVLYFVVAYIAGSVVGGIIGGPGPSSVTVNLPAS